VGVEVESTVVYEVTADGRADLWDGYEDYMRDKHIPDLLRTGKFVGASLEVSSPGRYRIRYFAKSRSVLDEYLEKDAPRLRADFVEHFPDGIEVTRAEWTVVKSFP
jgi:hypothetical protein